MDKTVAEPEDLPELDAEVLANDPAVADCYLRDIREEELIQRLRGQLKNHDPSYRRVQLLEEAVSRDPLAVVPNERETHESDFSDVDDEDGDSELLRIQELRLTELRRAARQEVGTSETVRRIRGTALAAILQETSSRTVVHMHRGWGADAVAGVDEVLSECASDDPATSWYTCDVSGHVAWEKQLDGVEMPAVAVFGPGRGLEAVVSIVARFCFRDTTDGVDRELDQQGLRDWLRSVGRGDAARGVHERGRGQQADGAAAEPCEVCGRCYPHTHLKDAQTIRSTLLSSGDTEFGF